MTIVTSLLSLMGHNPAIPLFWWRFINTYGSATLMVVSIHYLISANLPLMVRQAHHRMENKPITSTSPFTLSLSKGERRRSGRRALIRIHYVELHFCYFLQLQSYKSTSIKPFTT